MTYFQALFHEVAADRLVWTMAGLLAGLALLRAFAPADRQRRLAMAVLYGLHLALVPVAALLHAEGSGGYRAVRLGALALVALSLIGLSTSLVFDLVLPRLRIRAPRILRDLASVAAAAVALFAIASRLGFNLSGLIATSAVLTALIGFSLQDTLGNLMGGIALQLDSSVRVGDWIRVGDPQTPVNGRVAEIRWRYTAVETRNGETIIVPNGLLLKGQVTVLGRRAGKPLSWRRWVWFNVDFRFAPSRVIEIATRAVSEVPIPNVAADPRPSVVLMDLHESYGRYACRYWLTDLAVDDPTDSAVRVRIWFALRREGIALSIPAHAIFITHDSQARRTGKLDQDRARRLAAIGHVDHFAHLADEDRAKLADGLQHVPFTASEIITRQGAEGHWLYIVDAGEVSVRVAVEGGLEREVARLGPGNFFGEMSLLTGAPRSATVVALGDVECYRLDKGVFTEIIRARPELAERVAAILAERRIRLEHVKDDLSEEARAAKIETRARDLLDAIRDFFGLAS